MRARPASSRPTGPSETADLVGGLVAARGEAMAAGLVASDRQLNLWYRILRCRYLVGIALAAAALLPAAGPRRYWLAVLMVAAAVPVNYVYEQIVRRTSVLHPTVAFADHVFGVAALAFMPEIWAPVGLFQLAVLAANIVAFGRRVAAQAGMVGLMGYAIVVYAQGDPDAVLGVITLGLLGAFVLYGVGLVSEDQQDLALRYRDLTSNIDAVVWERRRERPGSLYLSDRVEALTGWSAADLRSVSMWERLTHPDDRETARARYAAAMRSGGADVIEYRIRRRDGSVRWIQDRMRVTTDAHGRWITVSGLVVDVTARKEAERQISQFVNVVDNIHLGLVVLGLDHPDDPDDTLRVLAVNPAAAKLAGGDADALIGRRALDVLPIPEAAEAVPRLALVARSGVGFTVDEYRLAALGPTPRVYSVSAFPLPSTAVALSINDITERTTAAEVLRRQALHDGLTGLPNRTLLNERLRNALKRMRRGGDPVSLLVMDLDHFKDVNDALGHEQGDRLLIEISRRLQSVVTEADTVARLGGDEFAVLLTGQADEAAARRVATRIGKALEEPFHLGGITLESAASIGIAVAPTHGSEGETLAQRADVAMYAAKRSGAGACVYARELDQSSLRRLALLGELRAAISEDDLRLRFQPCLDLATGEVNSAEALVRWQHPTHGLLPPSEFIELAEVSGLIRPLTRWVIENVLGQIHAWSREGITLRVAANLSVKDLYDRDLVPWLDDRLDAWGVDASSLKLEITESELMDDPLLALEVLGRLRTLGVQTSIDDFGTGYSSLAYLKHLPIDELKIDKSFVGNLVHDPNDLVIVRSTIDLAHNLGLSVVAEGVEDGATLQRLAQLGCDRAQGFFMSRPLAGTAVPGWLATRARRRRELARGDARGA